MALETFYRFIDLGSLSNLQNPFSSKKFLILIQVEQYWSIFVDWIIKNPNFYQYLAILMSEAAEASQCYFFEIIIIKLKYPNLPNGLLPFFELGSQLQLAILDFKVCHIEFEHPVFLIVNIQGELLTSLLFTTRHSNHNDKLQNNEQKYGNWQFKARPLLHNHCALLSHIKDQAKSKLFFQADVSSKKQTNVLYLTLKIVNTFQD